MKHIRLTLLFLVWNSSMISFSRDFMIQYLHFNFGWDCRCRHYISAIQMSLSPEMKSKKLQLIFFVLPWYWPNKCDKKEAVKKSFAKKVPHISSMFFCVCGHEWNKAPFYTGTGTSKWDFLLNKAWNEL